MLNTEWMYCASSAKLASSEWLCLVREIFPAPFCWISTTNLATCTWTSIKESFLWKSFAGHRTAPPRYREPSYTSGLPRRNARYQRIYRPLLHVKNNYLSYDWCMA